MKKKVDFYSYNVDTGKFDMKTNIDLYITKDYDHRSVAFVDDGVNELHVSIFPNMFFISKYTNEYRVWTNINESNAKIMRKKFLNTLYTNISSNIHEACKKLEKYEQYLSILTTNLDEKSSQ